MLQQCAECADSFSRGTPPEYERPTVPAELTRPSKYEIVLDNDATEEEVEYYLHNPDTD